MLRELKVLLSSYAFYRVILSIHCVVFSRVLLDHLYFNIPSSSHPFITHMYSLCTSTKVRRCRHVFHSTLPSSDFFAKNILWESNRRFATNPFTLDRLPTKSFRFLLYFPLKVFTYPNISPHTIQRSISFFIQQQTSIQYICFHSFIRLLIYLLYIYL